MIETAMVFNKDLVPIYWHTPNNRSAGHIGDSRDLWEVLWDNRENLGGVAHTHPWNGTASPSQTDITTFRAVEQGLGKLLLWPVVTFTEVRYYVYNVVTGEYVEAGEPIVELRGLERLRQLSGKPSEEKVPEP